MKSFALVFFLSAAAASGQDLSGFTKVLLPVFTKSDAAGANGSRFFTVLTAAVDPDLPLKYYPATGDVIIGGQAGIGEMVHQQGFNIFAAVAGESGRLLYIDANVADHVTFSYWLSSTARGSANRPLETELPVVRERDFLTGRTYVSGLPNRPIIEGAANGQGTLAGYATRSRFRVYDVDNSGTLSVHLKLFYRFAEDGSVTPVYETDVIADRRDFNDPSYPFYGQIDLPNYCSGSANPLLPCVALESLSLQITPNTNARYWAFVSSTDNVTQQVRIHHPQ